MRTFITRINGLCDSQMKEKQENVANSAYSTGCMDMALYVYSNFSETIENRNSRFDGIIAGITRGDTVILQLPTGNGHAWEQSLISHIKVYGAEIIPWLHDTEYASGSVHDSIEDYVALCSSQKTVIVNSLAKKQELYKKGLNKETNIFVCENADEKVCKKDLICKTLYMACENVHGYNSLYKMVDTESVRQEVTDSYINAIVRKSADNEHIISVTGKCDADGYLVYSDNRLVKECDYTSFLEVHVNSELASDNYVIKAFVYTLTGKRIVASADAILGENGNWTDCYKLIDWDDEEQIKSVYNHIEPGREEVCEYLQQYDLISFDIFDTLITRNIYRPDDVFKLMGELINKRYDMAIDYMTVRKKAESQANQKRGAYCSIYDIYDELKGIADISAELAHEWMELEIETEYDLCIPRKEMQEIFECQKRAGKKIVLVSDMYLTGKEISRMLEKCGYTGYDEMWISCEKGLRKDNGSMWKSFFKTYGKEKTIHVGDSLFSDINMVRKMGRDIFYVRSPHDNFEKSMYGSRLIQYADNSIENSILLGMVVNGYLFNSPFCMDYDGHNKNIGPDEMGAIAFGPLFSYFINWIHDNTDSDNSLLFLAREGYILYKLYQEYCDAFHMDNRDGIYFLTSRRAASVAAIQNAEDIEEILKIAYTGTMSNLLKTRLGIDMKAEWEDCNVAMPRDISKVMGMLEPYLGEIFEQASSEKQAYLKYIDMLNISKEKMTVVDVGYSGTIQYFLSKMLNKKIDGCYMIMSSNRKPEKIGCECRNIFSLDEFTVNTLFLEAVLKAPYGQLERFNECNEAVCKDDNQVEPWIQNMQSGIVDFLANCWKIMGKYIPDFELNRDFAMCILENAFSERWFTITNVATFTVQDDYCANGEMSYHSDSKSWNMT